MKRKESLVKVLLNRFHLNINTMDLIYSFRENSVRTCLYTTIISSMGKYQEHLCLYEDQSFNFESSTDLLGYIQNQ